jgi:hypothetical protein
VSGGPPPRSDGEHQNHVELVFDKPTTAKITYEEEVTTEVP